MNKLKFVFVLCLTCLGFFSAVFAQAPTDLFGVWEVSRYAKVKGSMTDVPATVGKRLEFDKDSFRSPQDFIHFKKGVYEGAVYTWKTISLSGGDEDMRYLALNFGPDDEDEGKTETHLLKIKVKDHTTYYFQLTPKNELAYYFDGYVIFFKKTKTENNGNSKGCVFRN